MGLALGVLLIACGKTPPPTRGVLYKQNCSGQQAVTAIAPAQLPPDNVALIRAIINASGTILRDLDEAARPTEKRGQGYLWFSRVPN